MKRLNVILSHAFDPTCWVREATDGAVPDAFVDVEAQTAWLVSIERLLADGLFLLSQPSAPALARVQAAFDLLDKAEALIGYGKDRSGEGFAALLRRRHSVRRINAAWQTMPPVLARRFTERTRSLFDSFYEQMRKDAAGPRLTAKGIKLAGRGGSKLEACSMDDYVAALCRAVRNSSHGLLRILTSDHDRYVLATHTGAMPRELTDIAVLVMFALVADAEKLCQGTWAYGLAD